MLKIITGISQMFSNAKDVKQRLEMKKVCAFIEQLMMIALLVKYVEKHINIMARW